MVGLQWICSCSIIDGPQGMSNFLQGFNEYYDSDLKTLGLLPSRSLSLDKEVEMTESCH